MKRVYALLLCLFGVLFAGALPAGCADDASLLRAKQVEHRSELVGGPVAMADVGDFLLENDQIRVNILRAIDSPGPGVFGGSIVDIDLRRARIGFQGGNGRDRFAETFPVANLMVPEPSSMEVRVLKDGSDGQEAIIRVEGTGEFLFEALAILRTKQSILDLLYPNVITQIHFSTDYILRPGARHIHMVTTLTRGDVLPEGCPAYEPCDNDCPYGRAQGADGCLSCECSEALPLEQYSSTVNVFGRILGDPPDEPDSVLEPGILAGDFVFFGNQNDVFAPGPGFDEDGAVQRAFNNGRNTFQEPLLYDYVAAAGGDISYGYFTVAKPGEPDTVVNVPLFASAATTFLVAGKSCEFAAADDDSCDKHRAFTFERYLAVGEGDIASVTEEMYRVRGTPTGALTGRVMYSNGQPVLNARLFAFSDPDPSRVWTTVDELARANREATGNEGLVNAFDADLGLDLEEDGAFSVRLPFGRYLIVARNPDGTAASQPYAVNILDDSAIDLLAVMPLPGRVQYRVLDDHGLGIPAKLTMVSLDESGQPLFGNGLRKPFLGEGRLGNGVRHVEVTAHGSGEVEVEPGRYRIVVSRGIEYSIHTFADVVVAPAGVLRLDAMLVREIDSAGWMSTDMHLHSRPSFDSGMQIERRVLAAAAEGLEFAVSTDHDVATDYRPTIAELDLEPVIASAVGAEITTLEQGHFIGFPLKYDETIVPTHGAHDWTCQAGAQILDGIRAIGDEIQPFTIVAHPRDGFFGYIDQLGVDSYNMTRKTSLLEEDNPVFRTAGCNFDGMEVIANKRYDLTRTPSVAEVVNWARCLERLDASSSREELAASCPELAPDGLAYACPDSMLFEDCRDANRTALAWATTKLMLERTPEEQVADWLWPGTSADTEALCNPANLEDDPVDPSVAHYPCAFRAGQVDDFFRYLERGLTATQIASSDSHDSAVEPGYPRTYFASKTDSTAALEVADVVTSLRAGHAFNTYGPFVRATINGGSYGDVVAAAPGGTVELLLDIQTASWFGIDRVEIYLNGELRRLLNPANPPETILDVHGKISLAVPARDSWVVVVAMGLEEQNLLRPVALDVPFGDVQLSVVAADAFSRIPVINSFFASEPIMPDWSPAVPYAITNPIYLDVDGNGVYDAPLPFPEFCSRPCDPAVGGECPAGQTCLQEERVCGFPITGTCNRRVASQGGH